MGWVRGMGKASAKGFGEAATRQAEMAMMAAAGLNSIFSFQVWNDGLRLSGVSEGGVVLF